VGNTFVYLRNWYLINW